VLGSISKLSRRLNKKLKALEELVLKEMPRLEPHKKLEVYEAMSKVYDSKISSIKPNMNSLKKVASGNKETT